MVCSPRARERRPHGQETKAAKSGRPPALAKGLPDPIELRRLTAVAAARRWLPALPASCSPTLHTHRPVCALQGTDESTKTGTNRSGSMHPPPVQLQLDSSDSARPTDVRSSARFRLCVCGMDDYRRVPVRAPGLCRRRSRIRTCRFPLCSGLSRPDHACVRACMHADERPRLRRSQPAAVLPFWRRPSTITLGRPASVRVQAVLVPRAPAPAGQPAMAATSGPRRACAPSA